MYFLKVNAILGILQKKENYKIRNRIIYNKIDFVYRIRRAQTSYEHTLLSSRFGARNAKNPVV